MDAFRCPMLDALGRELIEAYRRIDDRELFSQFNCESPEIERIHLALAGHRKTCALCQQLARSPGHSPRYSVHLSN